MAVFDHGAAPPGLSDRVFRFNYLRDRLASGLGLAGFAFERDVGPRSHDPPARRREYRARRSAPAAHGHRAGGRARRTGGRHASAPPHAPIVANVGNFHCLAFHLVDGRVAGLFEHHTGELSSDGLAAYVRQLADGSITNAAVFADKGHGALVLEPDAPAPDLLAVTGPRRALLVESGLQPYLAVPHGDMMLAGQPRSTTRLRAARSDRS